MATLQDLTDAIDSLLQHPMGLNSYQLVQQVAEKAYEAYVFGLCLRAVRELGVTPDLRAIDGSYNPTPFIFRGAPGAIHSNYRNYGYAEFDLNGSEFEIHAGVEFIGTSSMTHELDVCIITAEAARACRASPADPSAASLVGGWECKFYDGNIDKVLGRAFVGLMDDMGANARLSGMCSNKEHPQLRAFFRPQRRPYPHFFLSPLYGSNEAVFVNQIKGELKKMAGV